MEHGTISNVFGRLRRTPKVVSGTESCIQNVLRINADLEVLRKRTPCRQVVRLDSPKNDHQVIFVSLDAKLENRCRPIHQPTNII